MVGVQVTILVDVTVFDVAGLQSANGHKDGVCVCVPVMIHKKSLFLDGQSSELLVVTELVHVSHHRHHREKAKDLNDFSIES